MRKTKRQHDSGDDASAAPPSKKPRITKNSNAKIFPFGNYNLYYDMRRVVQKDELDKRVPIIQKHLPENYIHAKQCLDIGCNAGMLTMQIAKQFQVASMHGVDIDSELIQRANKVLEELKQQQETDSKTAFPNNVTFEQQNFVQLNAENTHVNTFDVIFCMSVTKWIHLNYGDDGMKRLFQKVHASLKDDGVFVLEPQNWKSYKKRKNLTSAIEAIFPTIKLRPSEFKQYLLEQIGFARVDVAFVSEDQDLHKKFNRPIYFLYKK